MKAAAFFVTVFACASIALSLSQSDARLDCRAQGDLLASLGRSKGPLSRVQRSCNGRIVVETRVDSRVLELKLVGQRDCTNKTYQVELEGSVKVVVGERGCTTAIHKRGRRLLITRRSGVCFVNIRVLSCKNARTEKRPHLSRRWLPISHNKQSTRGISTVVTGAGSLLLYAGLVLVIAIASVTSLIGCCLAKSGRAEVTQEKPALPTDSDRKSSKSNSLSSSCEKEKYNQYLLDPPFCEDPSPYSCGPSPSPSACSSQSSTPPNTESFVTKASYLSDSGIEAARHYLANRELPKPEDAGVEVDAVPSPVAKPEETDEGQHIYFKLDGFQPTCASGSGEKLELRQEDEEDSQEETNLDLVGGARNSLTQKPRKYFVLEVTEDGPKMRESIDDDVTAANMLFEPGHEDQPQICSVCKQLVHSKQDSLYLVILPDEGTSEHKLPFPQATCPLPSPSANVCYQSHEGDAPEEPQEDGVDKIEHSEPRDGDKPEQIYYSLDVPPPVVCMQCVYSTEEEPLYNEVDEPQIDPIYERIKIANARQDTTTSHASSHTYASVPSIDRGQSEEEKPLVPQRLALQRDAREASEDYASIPSSPIYSQPELKPRVDIYDVVCSLRHKMKLRRQQSQQQQQHSRSSSPDPPPSPPVRDSSLHTTRSRTTSVDRPFVVAQRKRTGSYLMMNLDSIWQHQQANRYAPVSFGKPSLTKTPSKEAYPMRETQKRMFEYFKLQQQHAEEQPTVSDYEVPVRCTIPAAPQEKIPPPLLLQKLIRQSAVDSQSHESSKKLFRHTSSEPCLLSADKENSFDVLYKEQLSPPSSPSSDTGDQQLKATATSYDHPTSPNKSPLKRMSYPFL